MNVYTKLNKYFCGRDRTILKHIKRVFRKFTLENLMVYIYVMFHSDFWIMQGKYYKPHDDWLTEQLKNPVFSDLNSYTVDLGGKCIWVSNYPYSFGNVYNGKSITGGQMPSFKNIIKLKKMLDEL